MRIHQQVWTEASGWVSLRGYPVEDAQLVLVFGGREVLSAPHILDELRRTHPRAHLLGCSTAGEIRGTQVSDDSVAATAVRFDHTRVRAARVDLADHDSSYRAGAALAAAFEPQGLVHVFVLSDGLRVNGSELVKGLVEGLPGGVGLTGGLSGDGARFEQTVVALDGPPCAGSIAAVGFYGSHLQVGCGSMGGWDAFGPERLVTRSRGNVLYELDGRSALALYTEYLGEYAAGLPASGLLFPLSLRAAEGEAGIVRTILAVDPAEGAMTFAGDVPEGSYARLMKANFERLIDGATGAARRSRERLGASPPELGILISCVGRKLVLKQRVEEEVEGVHEVLGHDALLTGFYSYGEISPFTSTATCELHNQTMTITTLSER